MFTRIFLTIAITFTIACENDYKINERSAGTDDDVIVDPSKTPTPTPTPDPDTSVQLELKLVGEAGTKILEGASFEITASFTKEDKTVEDVSDKITWTSSDLEIAERDGTTVPVKYKTKKPGSITISAKGTGFKDGSLVVVVDEIFANAATLTGPSSVKVGECKSYIISGKHASKANARFENAVVFTPNSAVNGRIFRNSACSTALTTISVQSPTIVYFKSTINTDVSLKFSAGSLSTNELAIDVLDQNANALKLSSSIASPKVDSCVPLTLSVVDQFNNILQAQNDAINGSFATDLGGKFYANSTCSNQITSFQLQGTTTSKSYYYKNLTAGANTLIASPSSGGVAAATLNLSLAPDPSLTLEIAGPEVIEQNKCVVFTVNVRDKFGNLTNAPADSILQIRTTQANSIKIKNSTCASNLTALFMSNKKTETFGIRAETSNNLSFTLTVEIDGTEITKSKVIYAGRAVHSIALIRQTAQETSNKVIKDLCHLFYVKTVDSESKVTASALEHEVRLSVKDGEADFYTNGTCSGAKLANNRLTLAKLSNNVIVFVKPRSFGNLEIEGASDGLQTSLLDLNVVDGPTAIDISGPRRVERNTCEGPFSVSLKDGMQSETFEQDLKLQAFSSSSGKGTFSFFNNEDCSENSDLTILKGSTSKQFFLRFNCSANCLSIANVILIGHFYGFQVNGQHSVEISN